MFSHITKEQKSNYFFNNKYHIKERKNTRQLINCSLHMTDDALGVIPIATIDGLSSFTDFRFVSVDN